MSVNTVDSAPWHAQDIGCAADARALAAEVIRRFPHAAMNHDPEWLDAGRAPDERIVAIVDRSSDGLCGYVPIRISSGALEYQIKEVQLFKTRLQEFHLTGLPLTRHENCAAALQAALDKLADLMPAASFASLGAVPTDSALHSLLSAPKGAIHRRFHVMRWGDENQHCVIDWTGSVETYLATLGPESRRNFKRYAKKLFGNADLKARVARFQRTDEIAKFLDDGIRVSDKTYQKQSLGLGIRRGDALERRFRFAAERAGFLGHILYLGDAPAAFHYGYIYGRTFYVVQMGYDPVYATHQPGNTLFYSVLQDVERLRLPIERIDCLPGVTDFKLRTTNHKIAIQHFYLFKRGIEGLLTYGALRALDMTARTLRWAVRQTPRSGQQRRYSTTNPHPSDGVSRARHTRVD